MGKMGQYFPQEAVGRTVLQLLFPRGEFREQIQVLGWVRGAG